MSKQSIYNMLASKAEPVKVELATIKPAQALALLKNIEKELITSESAINPALQKFIAALRDAEKKIQSIDSDLSTTIADAKQLGIDDYNQIPGIGESIKLIQQLTQSVKRLRMIYIP